VLGPGQVEALDQRLGLGEGVRLGVVVGADRQLPKSLDVLEQLVAAGFAQHASQQFPEQSDIRPQRLRDLVPGQASNRLWGALG
jgi:hypothetical protein